MQRIGPSLAIAVVALGVAALVGADEPAKAKPTPESIARRYFQGDGAGDRALAAEQALGLGKEGLLRLLDLVRTQGPVYDLLAEKKVSAAFDEMSLTDVAAFVSQQLGLKVEVAPEVEAGGRADLRVTLHFQKVPAGTLLGLLTQPHGLAWEPRSGGLWIGPAEERAGR
jgi:hypothetical protein